MLDTLHPINQLLAPALLAKLEVGQHYYWHIGGLKLHGQVFIVSWFVCALLIGVAFLATRKIERISLWPPELYGVRPGLHIAIWQKTRLVKKNIAPGFLLLARCFYSSLFPTGQVHSYPGKLIHIPGGELAAPTNDINTTVALALLTSLAYFYAGFRKRGLGYFAKYIEPTPILLPINILEDFTKPLSLSFRLFGNILADELVVAVLVLLVPLFVPLPVMVLGLFTSAIQALIFATLAAAYIGEAMEGH